GPSAVSAVAEQPGGGRELAQASVGVLAVAQRAPCDGGGRTVRLDSGHAADDTMPLRCGYAQVMATVTPDPLSDGQDPPAPAYGSGTISDVVPSALAVLGLPDTTDRLDLHPLLGPAPVRRLCILLVDGLGAHQLAAAPDVAPFLTSRTAPATSGRMRVIGTGFPSTTAVSLSSLGTGLPPGEHGLVG